jgi:hypothetical protein
VGESKTRNAAETACVTLTGQASSKGFGVEMPVNLVYYAEGTYAHATKGTQLPTFLLTDLLPGLEAQRAIGNETDRKRNVGR